VRIRLNDAGSVFPCGHKVRLALSTTYWPMIWPSPVAATVQIFSGTLDLPQRVPKAADARLEPLSEPETASPEKPTLSHSAGVRTERIERLGLSLGTQYESEYRISETDPLSAVAELSNVQTISRQDWLVRIETALRVSGTDKVFLLHATMSAWEGDRRVCSREWDCDVPRDLL
jgi:uncharacterized protein